MPAVKVQRCPLGSPHDTKRTKQGSNQWISRKQMALIMLVLMLLVYSLDNASLRGILRLFADLSEHHNASLFPCACAEQF